MTTTVMDNDVVVRGCCHINTIPLERERALVEAIVYCLSPHYYSLLNRSLSIFNLTKIGRCSGALYRYCTVRTFEHAR